MRTFLVGTVEVGFCATGTDADERYRHISGVPGRFGCKCLKKPDCRILGFHVDNGSKYINHKVARVLDKLAAEFTKSHPRHSNDNGLAETKNGAIMRKHLGYSHIPQRFSAEINAFCMGL